MGGGVQGPGIARQRAGGLRPPAAPARTPTATCSPAPALARRPYGGCPGGRKDGTTMRGGRRRLAAGGPKAPRPAKQKSGARGPWPRAPLFQDASRPAAAPPRWVFHHRPKGNAKARPFGLSSPAPPPTRKKVVATASRSEGVYNRAGERERAFFRRGAATE